MLRFSIYPRIASLLACCSLLFGFVAQDSAVASIENDRAYEPEERLWYGEASDEVEELLSKLGHEVRKYPDSFARVALSYDRQKVKLFVTSGDAISSAPNVAEIINTNVDLVEIELVHHSESELVAAQNQIIDSLHDKGLVAVSLNPIKNKVVAAVEENSVANVLLTATQKSSSPSNSIFDVIIASPGKFSAGRYDDYPRYYMGGEIINLNGDKCSLGIPVSVNGIEGVLTAGHCGIGPFYTAKKRFVGATYTTSYPNNAEKFGDWQILYKASYAPNIFSGSASSNSNVNLKITAAGPREQGLEVCSSGIITGQVCRFVVEYVDIYFIADGVTVRKLASVYHDSDRNGFSDCDGWARGDSGGPVYSANRSGGMTVHGIVTGKYPLNWGRCRYVYTRLDGVTAWNSTVRVRY